MPSTPPPNNNHARSGGGGGGGGGYGLSLLDSSPITTTNVHNTDNSSSSSTEQADTTCLPYEHLLQQAAQWKMEMEQVRDSIYWLKLQNCQSLDGLCMAGADII